MSPPAPPASVAAPPPHPNASKLRLRAGLQRLLHLAAPFDLPLLALARLFEVVTVAIFILTFIVQPSRVPSSSMEPTLHVGDFFLLDKQSFASAGSLRPLLPPARLQHGDLIVFHFPPEPSVDLVKRVVALPGDRLHLSRGVLWRNGAPIAEPYTQHSLSTPDYFRDNFPDMGPGDPSLQLGWWAELPGHLRNGELIVPRGHYFVLGDNRNASDDSRYWGFVPQQDIVGRPLLVYFSLHRPSPPAAGPGPGPQPAPLPPSTAATRLPAPIADLLGPIRILH